MFKTSIKMDKMNISLHKMNCQADLANAPCLFAHYKNPRIA